MKSEGSLESTPQSVGTLKDCVRESSELDLCEHSNFAALPANPTENLSINHSAHL